METLKITNSCPGCNGKSIHRHTEYSIKSGEIRQIHYCDHCDKYFSETKNTVLSGLHTALSIIILVLNSLTEGMGINAICRVFHVSKNSIYRWQERLSQVKGVLLLYSLCHQFIQQIIEGDEIYTKVEKKRGASRIKRMDNYFNGSGIPIHLGNELRAQRSQDV